MQLLLPFKRKYPNTWKKMKMNFVVQELRQYEIGKDEKKEWKEFVLLKFKDDKDKIDGDFNWRTKLTTSKMIKPGPPNQYFFTTKKKNHQPKQDHLKQ